MGVVPTEIDFLDEVTDENMAELVRATREAFDAWEGEGSPEVTIYINSGGGDLSAALSAYDRLRLLAKRYDGRVVTVATGLCLSAAVVLLQAGTERLATAHTTFMLHAPFQYTWEKDQKTIRMHELEGRLALNEVTLELLVNVLSARTPVGAGDWRSKISRGPEDFFDAAKARNIGLVDRVLVA